MKRRLSGMRLLPVTLRGRLSLSVVIASALLFMTVYGVTLIATSRQARDLALADASDRMASAEQLFRLEERELGAYAVNYAQWDEFYDQSVRLRPGWIDDELEPWLRNVSGATLVLWTDLKGTAFFEYGDARDLEAVRHVALASKGQPVAGVMSIGGVPCAVAVRPIVGDPPGSSVGYIALARPLAPGVDDLEVPSHITQLSLTGGELAVPEDWTDLATVKGFDRVVGHFERGNTLSVAASITSLDGRPAGVLQMVGVDPWNEVAPNDSNLVAVLLGLGSLLLGLAFGLLLAQFIREPVEHFVKYLRDQGSLAIEGLPFEEHLEMDAHLTTDFKQLGEVIESVFTQLGTRQAELKQANAQVVSAERALRTVVNESSEAKLLVTNGIIEIANPAAGVWLGAFEDQLVGRPIGSVFENASITTEQGESLTLDELLERALGRAITARFKLGDMEERWISASVIATLSTGSYLLTARNVGEEHRLEELRAEIVSLVSHDLRAPLTVMSGYLDLLERPLSDQARDKAVAEMRAAAGRMTMLLESLLDATRTEQALAPSRFEEVSLSELADAVAETAEVATGRHVDVIKKAEAVVLGDEPRLRRALENLVGNARKHAPDHAGIRIIVDTTPKMALLAVEDDGPGIPDGQYESVFERFTQLKADSAPSGIGMGLYIVRAIAEGHGGSVRAEDAASGGARFVINLPLAPGMAPSTQPD
ncbi:MAG: ATP-binding protein [Coriobacteriia bacterium]